MTTHWKTIIAAGIVGAAMAYAIPAQSEPAKEPSVKIIDSDKGGTVSVYVDKVDRAIKNRTYVKIRGNCWSACTLYLRLIEHDLLCVYPSASFHFHKPFYRKDGEKFPMNDQYQDWFFRQYPNLVQMRLADYGGLTMEWMHIMGSVMNKYFGPKCED